VAAPRKRRAPAPAAAAFHRLPAPEATPQTRSRLPGYRFWMAVLLGAWLERLVLPFHALWQFTDLALIVATAVVLLTGYRQAARRRLRSRAAPGADSDETT
jgi:hypothetical protein